MDGDTVRIADLVRWVLIGQAVLSGLLALGISVYALTYFAVARYWRRFTFMAAFAPSYVAMFIFIALDVKSRFGRSLSWRSWFGLATFTVADYAMCVLVGHLVVRRKPWRDRLEKLTIIHDSAFEARCERER